MTTSQRCTSAECSALSYLTRIGQVLLLKSGEGRYASLFPMDASCDAMLRDVVKLSVCCPCSESRAVSRVWIEKM